MADGPLFDDWFIRITLAAPYDSVHKAAITIGWQNPERDAMVIKQITSSDPELIGELVAAIVTGYLVSRGTGASLALKRFERSKLLH